MGRESCTLTDYPPGGGAHTRGRNFEYLTLGMTGNLSKVGNVDRFARQLSNQTAVAIINISNQNTRQANSRIC